MVLTVDVQVEGVHFRAEWLTFRELGSRAVAASVSDLAAQGARPVCVLASIVAPSSLAEREFRALYRGIRDAAIGYGARVAGGNLSSGPLSVTITAVGEAPRRRRCTRSGARPGDEIWVTGSPGLARLGLQDLLEGGRSRPGRAPRALRPAIRAFTRPRARVAESEEILRRMAPTAMIDLSDGLTSDLGHVIDESSAAGDRPVGAVLESEALQELPGLRAAAEALGRSAVATSLEGGDDYELLITRRPRAARRRSGDRLTLCTGVSLSRVGRVAERPGIWLEEPGGAVRRVGRLGWEHR